MYRFLISLGLILLGFILLMFSLFSSTKKEKDNFSNNTKIDTSHEIIKRGIEGVEPIANNWGLDYYCLRKDVTPGEIITYYHEPGTTVHVRTVEEQDPDVWVCDRNGKPLVDALDIKEDYGYSEYYSKNTKVIYYLVKRGSVIGIGTKK